MQLPLRYFFVLQSNIYLFFSESISYTALLPSSVLLRVRLGQLSSYGSSFEWKRNGGLGLPGIKTGPLGASFFLAARK